MTLAAVPSAWEIYLHFPLLLVVVNLVYSATRYDDWKKIADHAIRGIVYIVVFLTMVFAVLYGLSLLVPRIFG